MLKMKNFLLLGILFLLFSCSKGGSATTGDLDAIMIKAPGCGKNDWFIQVVQTKTYYSPENTLSDAFKFDSLKVTIQMSFDFNVPAQKCAWKNNVDFYPVELLKINKR
jgi:hypothetical protein